jgi:hypothetical protein
VIDGDEWQPYMTSSKYLHLPKISRLQDGTWGWTRILESLLAPLYFVKKTKGGGKLPIT